MCGFGVPPAPETGDTALSVTPARARPGQAGGQSWFQTRSRVHGLRAERCANQGRQIHLLIEELPLAFPPTKGLPFLCPRKSAQGLWGEVGPALPAAPCPPGAGSPGCWGLLPFPAEWSLCPLRPFCPLHPSVLSPLYNPQPPFHPLPPPPPCTPLHALCTLPPGLQAGGRSLVPSSWLSRLLGPSLTQEEPSATLHGDRWLVPHMLVLICSPFIHLFTDVLI